MFAVPYSDRSLKTAIVYKLHTKMHGNCSLCTDFCDFLIRSDTTNTIKPSTGKFLKAKKLKSKNFKFQV